MKKIIIFKSECWDDGDYIITMRPEKATSYLSVPIGRVFSKKEADKIVNWLQENIEIIQKIIIQTENDPNV